MLPPSGAGTHVGARARARAHGYVLSFGIAGIAGIAAAVAAAVAAGHAVRCQRWRPSAPRAG
jgi:hypothetical protein